MPSMPGIFCINFHPLPHTNSITLGGCGNIAELRRQKGHPAMHGSDTYLRLSPIPAGR